jgi:hypothetical protein
MLRSIALIAINVAVGATTTPVMATDAHFQAMLKQLDPDTRLDQICAAEAMDRVGREGKTYRPERAVTDATAPAIVKDNTLRSAGGAFRSKGHWYQVSFTCKTSPDHMEVLSFDYRIGAPIPEDKWASYGLTR